ncbi:MAG: acetolactate synthase large subunit [Acidimicrobiales bacterium]|nr:acetolactate synthase large subunit [Acidimicrobiales bacterium]
MDGAQALMRAAADAGITACFANPGTTEMQLVGALDHEPRIRAVLGLFEGVVTGAADGYGRMADLPALTILHLGPGLANGLANLHNARRANSAVVNLVGDHATWHRDADPPLATDIVSLAEPMSGWVRTARHPSDVAADGAEAIAASIEPPGQVATLVVPQDVAWGEIEQQPSPAVEPAPRALVPPARVDAIAQTLRAAGDSGILLVGGTGNRRDGLFAAARIGSATGCRVLTESNPARLERGAGIPSFGRVPYFPEQAVEVFESASVLVLAGATDPVAFFGYPGQRSHPRSESCELARLAEPGDDVVHALDALAAALDAPSVSTPGGSVPPVPTGAELGPAELGAALASLQPEGAIVVDEAITSGGPYASAARMAPPHDVLALTGGAIGYGLPAAVGAAVACPDRRVIALEADGSGMYTLQALWTMAREGLDVTVVVCANRTYRILEIELLRAGVTDPGPAAASLTGLGSPDLDWVSLARGMGVEAVAADTADGLVDGLRRSFGTDGPMLIEARL